MIETETLKDPLHLCVRTYTSTSAEQTEQEIRSQKVKSSRNLLRLEFIKKRKDF